MPKATLTHSFLLLQPPLHAPLISDRLLREEGPHRRAGLGGLWVLPPMPKFEPEWTSRQNDRRPPAEARFLEAFFLELLPPFPPTPSFSKPYVQNGSATQGNRPPLPDLFFLFFPFYILYFCLSISDTYG